MLLGDFHQHVKDAVKRGTTLDALIITATKQAALWLERNRTFKYMERYVTFNLDPSAANPRAVALPSGGIKSIEFMNLLLATGGRQGLFQIDPEDVTLVETAAPNGYWIDSDQYFWFDNTPDQVYNLEMSYARFTSWPTDLTSEPWLLKWADDLMLAQTVMQLNPFLRDDQMFTRMKVLRDESLRTILLTDEELRQSGRSDALRFA